VIGAGSAAPPLRGQPVFGLPFDLERVRLRGAVAVVFMAPLLAGVSQRNLAALTSVWPRIDAEAGGLVLVSRSPLETARDFVPRHHLLFPMLVDETGEMAAAWGVGKAAGLASRLVRARPAFVRNALSVWRNGQPLPEANEDALPAAFVVAADGLVSWVWRATAVNDRLDAEAVWAAMRS